MFKTFFIHHNAKINMTLTFFQGACGSPAIIKKDDEYILRIDAVEISQSRTLTRALICFIASFYVFNLAYPKPCKKSLAFMQRIFLKISDNEKVDRSVLQLQEKIYNISMQCLQKNCVTFGTIQSDNFVENLIEISKRFKLCTQQL